MAKSVIPKSLASDVNDLASDVNALNAKKMQVQTLTGTMSTSGNLNYQFSSTVIIVSAWPINRGDIIVLSFPSTGNRTRWWFHCIGASSGHPIQSGDITIGFAYIVD